MTASELKVIDRKARRKEERLAKKKRKNHHDLQSTDNKEIVQNSIEKKEEKTKKIKHNKNKKTKLIQSIDDETVDKLFSDDPYAKLDPQLASEMRQDDEEIAALSAKLGGKKDKKRLHKEYSKLEGFGDDFGNFLDALDEVVDRVVSGENDTNENEPYKPLLIDNDDDASIVKNNYSSDSELEEEYVPMKNPAIDDLDDDDSVLAELKLMEAEDNRNYEEDNNDDQSQSDSEYSSDESKENVDDEITTGVDTYKPSKGEDIYGNTLSTTGDDGATSKKYTPPHLRNQNNIDEDDKTYRESLLSIQKTLNSSLNRLSEDSIVPVAQSIAQLYSSNPKSDVNLCIWKNARNACVARSHQMTALIPIYVCALSGVHLLKGDKADLADFLMEHVIIDLMEELTKLHESTESSSNKDDMMNSKEASNLILFLCYLYNYGVVHCTLLYDLVRHLIKNFTEIDIELLLVILSNCGRSLRSDDPSALKDIVLLAQKRSMDTNRTKSSRIDFMVTAITDLKNNKRSKADESLRDKTSKLRKALGQIKSNAAALNIRATEATAKITIDDILNAKTKGRWWKVGASWVGNLSRKEDNTSEIEEKELQERANANKLIHGQESEELLKLASKLRMNTDLRRSIFCVIMGSTDYEDCFEKLVRSGMLKNRTERDTIRVLMICCGHEKAYNKFYSHLAARICEFQMQCKFTLQLAFWDTFKQFEEISARKAANLAKLLCNLIVVHNCLKLNVLKAIDMSTPEELDENAMIFLTVFFSNILEHHGDESDVHRLFTIGSATEKNAEIDIYDGENEEMGNIDDSEALRTNITVFLVQVMKASPKYKKGSKFRANLKAAIKSCDPDVFA